MKNRKNDDEGEAGVGQVRQRRRLGGGGHLVGHVGDTAVAVHPDDPRYGHLPRPARWSSRSPGGPIPGIPGDLQVLVSTRHRRGEGHARPTTPTTSRSAGGTACPA